MSASSDSIAVVVAHPDDEVLAFGGTICKHRDAGDDVHVLFLSTGLAARTDVGDIAQDDLEQLRNEARAAGKVLGTTSIEFADFPDNRMDTVALLDVIKRVTIFIEDTKAGIVYTHHIGDLNIDHSITARAVLTACRPLPGSGIRKIFSGEVLSSSEYANSEERFRPNTYIDIEKYIDRKQEALQCYAGELRNWPHPRSIEAVAHQAQLRGSECGHEAAEALILIREVAS